jgi:hypothetical protein
MDSSNPRSGRRRWTSKQRQRFLARFQESKLTQRDFANRHGVGLSALVKFDCQLNGSAAHSILFVMMAIHLLRVILGLFIYLPSWVSSRNRSIAEAHRLGPRSHASNFFTKLPEVPFGQSQVVCPE